MILALLLLSRTYWPIDLATYAQQGTKHTHIEVSGWVTYIGTEDDGDLHVRLCAVPDISGMDRKQCIIAECIPAMPCVKPPKGKQITVKGISRYDPEHQWREVHPIEEWKVKE